MSNHRVLLESVGRYARYVCCSCDNAEITQTNSMSFSTWAKKVQSFKILHPFDVPLFQLGGCKISLGRVVKSARAERNWTAEEMCETITKVKYPISIEELMGIEESKIDIRQSKYDWLIDCVIGIFGLGEDDRPWLEKLRSQAYSIEL